MTTKHPLVTALPCTREHREQASFADQVELQPEDGCWLWRGTTTRDGYGRVQWRGKKLLAHRRAWEIVNGPIPDGLVVCHRCDTPGCVRAERGGRGHLFLGTQRDNIRDAMRKGRHRCTRPAA